MLDVIRLDANISSSRNKMEERSIIVKIIL